MTRAIDSDCSRNIGLNERGAAPSARPNLKLRLGLALGQRPDSKCRSEGNSQCPDNPCCAHGQCRTQAHLTVYRQVTNGTPDDSRGTIASRLHESAIYRCRSRTGPPRTTIDACPIIVGRSHTRALHRRSSRQGLLGARAFQRGGCISGCGLHWGRHYRRGAVCAGWGWVLQDQVSDASAYSNQHHRQGGERVIAPPNSVPYFPEEAPRQLFRALRGQPSSRVYQNTLRVWRGFLWPCYARPHNGSL
jgi:hypothetical protein